MNGRTPIALHLRGLAAGLAPLLRFALIALAVLTVSRVMLAWSHADRLTDAGTPLAVVMTRAWHFDLVVISTVCAVVLLVHWLAPGAVLESAGWRSAVTAWLALWLMLIVWNEAATPDFIAEFGVRPNRLYLEYLDSPREVFATIWEAHRSALLTGLALTALAGWTAWRVLKPARERVAPYPLRLMALLPLVVVAGIGVRGGTGHRPLNISFAASSADPFVNDLALNSTYSAMHALLQMRRERRVLEGYGRIPRPEAIRRVHVGMQLSEQAFTNPARPTEHLLVPTAQPSTRPNLVILVQESLGAHYVASLGGAPVAQKIETWRERSLWFDQLYASGTRSARGLEAIATGFLPTRAASVLKLDGAQHNFFTLAAALRAQGYRTEFIYGGDSSFDNMRGFFLNNGFDRVLDWNDMLPTARFSTTWGVSDEDLYARVQHELDEHQRDGQPFFTLVFSTSNHPPYDFPDGRIQLYQQPKRKATNAARYADYAVGNFLESARQAPCWANTLFMLVADHESQTVGEGLVPVMSFHIPAFIAGGPVTPRVITRIVSQIDLLPTALSLMGIRSKLPAPGIDQSRVDIVGPGRAFMQFHENAAYRVGNDVVVLVPRQQPQHFRLDGLALRPQAPRPDLEQDALAFTQFAVMAYESGWYR